MAIAGEDITTAIVEASTSKSQWKNAKYERVAKGIFSLIAICAYTSLLVLLWIHTYNAIHVTAWFGALTSSTYTMVVYYQLLFSDSLCYHTTDFQLMNGSSSSLPNYLPDKAKAHPTIPYETVCHMSAMRGSTMHKLHITCVGYGSCSVATAAIMKLFELKGRPSGSPAHAQQVAAAVFLLMSTVGGVMAATFEVYGSPSFSKAWNQCTRVLHLSGGLSYGLFGCLSLCAWNGFDAVSVVLLTMSLSVAVLWKSQMVCQKRKGIAWNVYDDLEKESQEHDQRVHRQSQICVGLEVLGMAISTVCMVWAAYRMGDDSQSV